RARGRGRRGRTKNRRRGSGRSRAVRSRRRCSWRRATRSSFNGRRGCTRPSYRTSCRGPRP
ncbi:hypothetical protein HK101_010016, partial [Irineochytrium annulatum]